MQLNNLKKLEEYTKLLSKKLNRRVACRKLFKKTVTIFKDDIAKGDLFILWDYVNYTKKEKVKVITVNNSILWEFHRSNSSNEKFMEYTKQIRNTQLYDVPLNDYFSLFPMEKEQIDATVYEEEVYTESFGKSYTETSLPGSEITIQELSARDRVCIDLQLPLTDKKWINDLIKEKLKQ